MPAGVHNIIVEQGASFIELYTLRKSDRTPLDLEGMTARGQIRKTRKTDTVTCSFDLDFIEPRTTGQIRAYLSPETTAAIHCGETSTDAASKYVYDIEIIDGDDVVRILQGDVTVSPEVTR